MTKAFFLALIASFFCFLGCHTEKTTFRVIIKNHSQYTLNLSISDATAYGFPAQADIKPQTEFLLSEVTEKGRTDNYVFPGIPKSILTVTLDSNKTLEKSLSRADSYQNTQTDKTWTSVFILVDSLVK